MLSFPKGTVVTSQKVSLSMVSVYEIPAPKIGIWSLQVPSSAGTHTFDVKSTSESIIDFNYYFLVTIDRRRSKLEVFTSNQIIGELMRTFSNKTFNFHVWTSLVVLISIGGCNVY
jgi:hypothetical protein